MAGQYFDAETGLHYNYHRYYDPKIGRYLTPDPIGLAGGINPFVYANLNPINLIDPYGLYSWIEFGDDASNFSAGFGDTITFGGTAWIRGQWNKKIWSDEFDSIDPCSDSYVAGKWSGYAWEVGFGAEILRGFRWMKSAKGFEKAWSRDFRTGWHRLSKGKYPGAGKNLPHYDRRPGIGKHRPWEGGW